MAQDNDIFIVASLIFGVVIGWISMTFTILYDQYCINIVSVVLLNR